MTQKGINTALAALLASSAIVASISKPLTTHTGVKKFNTNTHPSLVQNSVFSKFPNTNEHSKWWAGTEKLCHQIDYPPILFDVSQRSPPIPQGDKAHRYGYLDVTAFYIGEISGGFVWQLVTGRDKDARRCVPLNTPEGLDASGQRQSGWRAWFESGSYR